MRLAKIRHDGLFIGFEDINLPDDRIPKGFSDLLPPDIPEGHHAVLNGAWIIVEGEPPADAKQTELEAQKIQAARAARDKLLIDTDWRVLRALEEGVDLSKAWKDYRQALRDIPQQPEFPDKIEWPVFGSITNEPTVEYDADVPKQFKYLLGELYGRY